MIKRPKNWKKIHEFYFFNKYIFKFFNNIISNKFKVNYYLMFNC